MDKLDEDEILSLAEKLARLGVTHFEGLGIKLTFRPDVTIPREVEPAKPIHSETFEEKRVRMFGDVRFPGTV